MRVKYEKRVVESSVNQELSSIVLTGNELRRLSPTVL